MEPVSEKKNRKLKKLLEDKHSISSSREGDICFKGDRAFLKKVKFFRGMGESE